MVLLASAASAQSEQYSSSGIFTDRASRQLLAYSPVSVKLLPSERNATKAAPDLVQPGQNRPRTDTQNTASTPLCENAILPRDTVRELIIDEATRQNADAALALAIAAEESDYGSNVNSKAGARGIMQLMPATASAYGVTSICDPKQNISGGVRFLKDLMQRFDGNVMLVVAAYNAGEERILRSRGIPAFPETVNYTAKVINRYYDFDNLLKGAGKTVPLRSAETRPAPSIISASSSGPQRQEWIGGSVLILNQEH
uniref:Lytic transglycosylase n=2 Tax=Ochrobactrum sp. LM19 TaxID=1449781 RepID=A0A0D5A0D2_9HYPH|nr:lytic transglycosylase [Ochrobactrum sp. LM19]